MLFSSILFICYFLPLMMAFYFALPKYRNSILLFSSLLFYAWGELLFLPVLLFSLLANYILAIKIHESERSKSYISIGIAVNLGILFIFKYAIFFSDTLESLVGWGIPGLSALPNRIPLGISFFTFQAMSYLIDVYRKDVPAEKNFQAVSLYIVMFPQLIAGPIVRFKDIVIEIHSRSVSFEQLSSGIRLFVMGLASKVLLANSLSIPADAAFGSDVSQVSAGLAWVGLVCYALQIYYDFAGYSWMAIGLGRMMGFEFPKNFNFPYRADSITDFWRRWHISLSTWFRDYLYIPLGGNQKGTFKTYRNLITVFLLCGIWHGANWTFVCWGIYYGLYLILEKFIGGFLKGLPVILRRAYVIIVVLGGWLLFRSDTLSHAGRYFGALAGMSREGILQKSAGVVLSPDVLLALGVGIFLSGVFGEVRFQNSPGKWAPLRTGLGSLSTAGLFVLCLSTLASGTHNPFIYFNF